MTAIRPFTLDVPEATLAEIRARVAAFPWHEMPADGGWDYGANLDYMRELCAYWLEGFDWRAQEERIKRFDHFLAEVGGRARESTCTSSTRRAAGRRRCR